MTSLKTPDQLTGAIESLVASYLADVRDAACQAVERALCRPTVAGRPSKRQVEGPAQPRQLAKRRSAAELEKLGERLYERVCARPGESMVTFAEELRASVSELQRPMARLKASGRVRSVGQRHLTRYFPAVVRASTSEG